MKKLLEAILKEAEQVDREVEGFRKAYGPILDGLQRRQRGDKNG